MKAVILAAGRGSRIGYLTKDTPKSMLKLNDNHTLLSHNFMQIKQCGIDSVILITGYCSNKLEEYSMNLSKKYNLKVDIVYNPFWNNCNVLGSLYFCLDKIDDDFMFFHADTIVDIKVIKELLLSKNDVCLAVDFKKCGEEEMKIWLSKGRICRITKANIGREAQGEFLGIAKFNKQIINYFIEKSKEIFKSGLLNSYMEEVLDQGLISKKIKVDYFDASSYNTIEIDFIEDLEKAKEMFK